MGAILAVFGEPGDPELSERLEKMIAVSPYRGKAERMYAPGAAMAIQTLGWDASIAKVGDLIVAFHGYIGNWQDLPLAKDAEAMADSNAQKIARAYLALGDSLWCKLRGEYSVLFFRETSRTVRAIRDLLGLRPLMVTSGLGRTFIGAEPEQLLAGTGGSFVVNRRVATKFCLSDSGVGNETLAEGLFRVLPGRIVDPAASPSEMWKAPAWWQGPTSGPLRMPDGDLRRYLRHLLEQGLRRAVPSRRFGLALSGGLDSGSIWGMLSAWAQRGDLDPEHLRAFSLVFPDRDCDESGFIDAVGRHTGNTKILKIDCSGLDPFDYLRDVGALAAVPLAFSITQMFLIGERLRGDSRDVMLLGSGEEWYQGDFSFCRRLFLSGHWIRLAKVVTRARPYISNQQSEANFWLRQIGLGRFAPGTEPRAVLQWKRQLRRGTMGARLRFLSEDTKWTQTDTGPTLVGVAQASNSQESAERVAARLGIELRQPFMDLDLVDFGLRVSAWDLTRGIRHKHTFRAAVADLLPYAVRERRYRTSFDPVPGYFWRSALARWPEPEAWTLVKAEILPVVTLMKLRALLQKNCGALDRPGPAKYDYLDLLQFAWELLAIESSLIGWGAERKG